MPYALRSTVNSADLEIADVLMSLKNARLSYIEDDSSEYIPDEPESYENGSVCDEDYVPETDDAEDDDEDYVPETDDAEDDDEDYVPETDDVEDDDEDYVPETDDAEDDDEDYTPETDDTLENVVRQACSSLSKGQELPRAFWRVMVLTRKNQVSANFKRWMLNIPPVKSIYASFSMRH